MSNSREKVPSSTPGVLRRGITSVICGLGNLLIRPLWRRRAQEDLRQADVKKILVVRDLFLGDVLQTTPLIRELRKNFPQANLTYIVSDGLKDVLEGSPYLDEVIGGDIWFNNTEGWSGRRQFIRQLREQKFGLVITLGTFAHYYLLSFFSGAKRRIGFDLNRRGFLLTRTIDWDWKSLENRVDRFLDVLGLIGLSPTKDTTLEIALSEEERTYAAGLLAESNISSSDLVVALLPGGGVHLGQEPSGRRWEREKFAELADILIDEYGAKIILVGSLDERKLCYQINDLMEHEAVNLAGKTTLKQLEAVLERVRLLVGNDSGPIFLAAAVGTSTIGIFGAEHPRRAKPLGPHHYAIRAVISCSPCYDPDRPVTCSELLCMSKIKTKDVLDLVAVELGLPTEAEAQAGQKSMSKTNLDEYNIFNV